jgi:hypothetical protein
MMNYTDLLVGAAETSDIADGDQEIYSAFFRRQWPQEHYGNSWSYLTQACRGLGYGRKYLTDDHLLSYGSHGHHYVIVRPIGHDLAPAVRSLAHHLHARSLLPVYIKHIEHVDATRLTASGDFFDMAKYPWCPEAKRDDASFPEVVVPIGEIFTGALHTPRYQKLRMMLNRFNNDAQGPVQLVVHRCPEHRDIRWELMARTVVHRWSRYDKCADAYANMLGSPSRHAMRYIVTLHGEPVAFYVFERIGESTAGCYASLSLHHRRRGLAETAMYRVFEILFQHEGIRRVNLGGSELHSLHKFKLKFGHEHENATTNLVFMPHTR